MRSPGNARPGRIVILGALSAIAEVTAREWARRGAHLMIAARDKQKLEASAADLRIRGGTVDTFVADLADADFEQAFSEMANRLGGVDVVLLSYGVLDDQRVAASEQQQAHHLLTANFTSAAGWCLAVADVLEKQGHGMLIVLGSVAGDRGRASNYVYGAAKGGLGILVQGIAHRLARTKARAVLIKPGCVDTPMTAAMPKKGLHWSKPEDIAKLIVRAADTNTKRTILYAPWYWRWIMLIVRTLPAFVLHRTKL